MHAQATHINKLIILHNEKDQGLDFFMPDFILQDMKRVKLENSHKLTVHQVGLAYSRRLSIRADITNHPDKTQDILLFTNFWYYK